MIVHQVLTLQGLHFINISQYQDRRKLCKMHKIQSTLSYDEAVNYWNSLDIAFILKPQPDNHPITNLNLSSTLPQFYVWKQSGN